MLLQRINKLFSFKRLLKLIVVFSIILQAIIILYNHFSGYYNVPDFLNFIRRLIYSTFFTVIAGFLISYPNLLIINNLNRLFAWSNNAIKRIGIQVVLTIIVAITVSTVITLIVHFIDLYSEGLLSVLVNNALIFSVVNIILITILEALIFFNDSKVAGIRAEKLEMELAQIKFEVLKNQINPHFMFNSLNVLSGLIESDLTNAQKFIDEFSLIYRYVLETIEKPIVTLHDELSFVRSYIFLQQMRYGNDLQINIEIAANLLHMYLPPLSLQTVLENAIKHNIINTKNPLIISIFNSDEYIYVRNNIQIKISNVYSSGVGQDNMIKRYAFICEKVPEFKVETSHYLVKLPLIENE